MSNEIVLKTGRRFYANRLIVGIDDKLEISEGYDGGIYTSDFCDPENNWSKEDRIALADMMIDRWKRFKKTE